MGDGALDDEQSVSIAELRDHVLLEYSTASESLRRRRHSKIISNLAKVCSRPSSPTIYATSDHLKALEAANCVKKLDIPAVILPVIEKLPDGILWVRATTNVRLPECFSDDYHVPYLGESDEHQASSSKLAKLLCDDDSEKEDNSDVEGLEPEHGVSSDIGDSDDDEGGEKKDGVLIVGENLDRVSRARKRSRRSHHKPELKERKLPSSGKVGELKWDRQAKLVALRRFSAVFLPPNSDELTPDCAKAVKEAFNLMHLSYAHAYMNIVAKRLNMWESKKKGEEQLDAVKTEVISHIEGNGSSSPATVLRGDSIPFFFCRQCYVYDCPLHGNCDSGPTVPIPDRTRKDSAYKHVIDHIEKSCRDLSAGNCWCLGSKDDECAKWWADSHQTSVNVIDDLKALLQKVLPTFGKDFCRVSETVRILLRDSHDVAHLTCCRIGYVSTVMFNNLLDTPVPSRIKKLQKLRSCKPAAEMEFMNGGIRPDYKPCRHDGPCTAENCTCVANGVFCEKYCGCNHSRPNQMKYMRHCNWAFPGCSCKSACSSNLCPCYSWKRECDPDLCRYCHDCKETEEGVPSFTCRNVNLRLKKNCRLLAGRSNVHGWGVFAANDIPQNEMVGEYVGEVLGDQVAERRGRLYDEVQSTFLFEITKGLSLDSTRIGNKLRYCNHSSDANLEPRLMRVAGDVRIGIFARRSIKKHEELFFNYGSKFKNRWEMKDSKDGKAKLRATKHKKTAVETLESDDENDFSSLGERVEGKILSNKIRKVNNGRNAMHNLKRQDRTSLGHNRRRNSLQGPASITNGTIDVFGENFTSAHKELQSRRRSVRLTQEPRLTPVGEVSNHGSGSEKNDAFFTTSTDPSGQASRSKIRSSPRSSLHVEGSLTFSPNQSQAVPPLKGCEEGFERRRVSVQVPTNGRNQGINAEGSFIPDKGQERVTRSTEGLIAEGNSGEKKPRLTLLGLDDNDGSYKYTSKRPQALKLGKRTAGGQSGTPNSRNFKSQFNGFQDKRTPPKGTDQDCGVVGREFCAEARPLSLTPPELATGTHLMSSASDADVDRVEKDDPVFKITPVRTVRNAIASVREELPSSKRRLSNPKTLQSSPGIESNDAKRHKLARGIGTAARGRDNTGEQVAMTGNQEVCQENATRGENVASASKRGNSPWKKSPREKQAGEFRWDQWRNRGPARAVESSKSTRDSKRKSTMLSRSPSATARRPRNSPGSVQLGRKSSAGLTIATKHSGAEDRLAMGSTSEVINLVTDDEDEQEAPDGPNHGDDSDTSFDPNFGKYTLT